MITPSKEAIAAAIVTACNWTGEDPIACARGEGHGEARTIAYIALVHLFPHAPTRLIWGGVGAGNAARLGNKGMPMPDDTRWYREAVRQVEKAIAAYTVTAEVIYLADRRRA